MLHSNCSQTIKSVEFFKVERIVEDSKNHETLIDSMLDLLGVREITQEDVENERFGTFHLKWEERPFVQMDSLLEGFNSCTKAGKMSAALGIINGLAERGYTHAGYTRNRRDGEIKLFVKFDVDQK